jgi:aromatic ring-opening dioxygenase catalytic subunit (LigB family)
MSAGVASTTAPTLPRTQLEWRAALAELPEPVAGKPIPAFYFAHGSPMLASVPEMRNRIPQMKPMGPDGPLAHFLRDFGKTLLNKYKPKGIVVFSAHWDAEGPALITDYGDENPLLYDYYGFDPEMYKLQFISKGNSALSNRVVEVLQKNGQAARTTPKTEARGRDGRGYKGPGFDHGVFIPFRIMFGETFTDVPIIEVSMNSSLDPDDEWALGAAVSDLRNEGLLVLAGGLTIHNLRDFAAFNPDSAGALYHEFDQACLDAVTIADPAERKYALQSLTNHRGFRAAHPHADHFVPLYIAAGAGGDGAVKVLQATYGVHTYAFGL